MSREPQSKGNASHAGKKPEWDAQQRLDNGKAQSNSDGTSSAQKQSDQCSDDYGSLEELVRQLPWNASHAENLDLRIDIDEIIRLSRAASTQ